MRKTTPKGEEREEPRPERKKRGIPKPDQDRPPSDEDAPRVRAEPYFPEVFLG